MDKSVNRRMEWLGLLGIALGILALGVGCGSELTQGQGGEQPRTTLATERAAKEWIGKEAIAFSLPDASGKPVDLTGVLGTKPVVLVFYRGVW